MLLSRNMVESIYENDCLTASGLPIFVQVLELLMEALQQAGCGQKYWDSPQHGIQLVRAQASRRARSSQIRHAVR